MLSNDAKELKMMLSEDSLMSMVSMEDLHGGAIGRYPAKGERTWLFHYKNAYIVLWDDSNGHYSFCCEIERP